MYLFTRRTRLAPGHGTAGVDWARSVAEKARALTGRDLRLWGTAYSAGVGTIWWTGWFEDFQALEQFGDTLAADPAMEKLTNAATRYTDGGFDDGIGEPGYGAPLDPTARYRVRPLAPGDAPSSIALTPMPWLEADLVLRGQMLAEIGLAAPPMHPEQLLLLHLTKV